MHVVNLSEDILYLDPVQTGALWLISNIKIKFVE